MAPVSSDLDHLRRAIQVSRDARDHGNHPFGAVLVDRDGAIVLEAENTVVTGDDVTGHAETNLVRRAWAELGWARLSPDELASYTLVTSCEPCAMCTGAIFWSGIGRVVFGLAESGLAGLTGPDAPLLAHPCRRVLADGNRVVEVSGPHLEDEAAEPHRGFWVE
jgi:tRNA(Arg) A34 adenosine deaminase TadA